ncbi:MAG: hypothetical protein ACE5G7_03810 [Candidatus Hydrothermarchaeaceae archaeon]
MSETVYLHRMLHGGIILLAALLSGVSVIAYLRDGRRKFLFICGAFLLFAVREFILFLEVNLVYPADVTIPMVQAPVTHLLSLMILVLFSGGVFTKN